MASDNQLPALFKPAQLKCALTADFKKVFIPSTFPNEGWLALCFVGDQESNIADYYSNTGSMYLTSLAFLPLGLNAHHEFWTAPFTDWIQRKVWRRGQPFKKDHTVDY